MTSRDRFALAPSLRGFALVAAREIGANFDSGIAYVATIAFSLLANSIFMNEFFLTGTVDMRGFFELLPQTFVQERPVLPAPHQIAAELWDTTVNKAITSKRSLIYHAGVTLSATLLGFAIGAVLGILLAVAIVHNRAMDRSVMPWIIASQSIVRSQNCQNGEDQRPATNAKLIRCTPPSRMFMMNRWPSTSTTSSRPEMRMNNQL